MKSFFFITILVLFYIAIFAQNKNQNEYQIVITQIENLKKEILVLKPDSPELVSKYLKIGYLYSQINEVDKAQEAFENVIKLDPKNDKAYFMLGLIYEKKKMTAQAIDAWQKCLNYTQNPEIKRTAQKHLDYLRK